MQPPIVQFDAISHSIEGQLILDDVTLDVKNGEFLTLLGPSGCGKTTLLKILSGFVEADEGRVLIAGRDVSALTPQMRDVHTVFQSYALFPHMSVYENVAFALRCQNVSNAEIKNRVDAMLERVKLYEHHHKKPARLSGGQQQRVALARALVTRPSVLLLDEPLSALDYRLRKTMQIELKQLQRELGITFIFVTHDQEEALSMSDRVAILHDGKIQQLGTPREVYEEPNNLTIAKFIGELNIFNAKVGDDLRIRPEGLPLRLENNKQFKAGDNVHVLIRPEDIQIWREKEKINHDEVIHAVIEEIIYKGSTVDFILKLDSGKKIMATEFFNEDDEDLVYTLGESIWWNWFPGWEVILIEES